MNQASPHKLLLLSNASADSAAFTISGGRWMIAASATWGGGNIKLSMLGPDGTTYVDIPSATLSANGAVAVQIPTGTYKIVRTTATAIYCSMHWIPE